MLEFSCSQAWQLLKLFGGDPEAMVSVAFHDIGPDGPGLYAWFTDYPESGKTRLVVDTTPRRDTVPVGACLVRTSLPIGGLADLFPKPKN